MTTSFPYLKIAKDHDVSYGEVIRYAAVLDIGEPLSPEWIIAGTWQRAACLAWRDERDRRRARQQIDRMLADQQITKNTPACLS